MPGAACQRRHATRQRKRQQEQIDDATSLLAHSGPDSATGGFLLGTRVVCVERLQSEGIVLGGSRRWNIQPLRDVGGNGAASGAGWNAPLGTLRDRRTTCMGSATCPSGWNCFRVRAISRAVRPSPCLPSAFARFALRRCHAGTRQCPGTLSASADCTAASSIRSPCPASVGWSCSAGSRRRCILARAGAGSACRPWSVACACPWLRTERRACLRSRLGSAGLPKRPSRSRHAAGIRTVTGGEYSDCLAGGSPLRWCAAGQRTTRACASNRTDPSWSNRASDQPEGGHRSGSEVVVDLDRSARGVSSKQV